MAGDRETFAASTGMTLAWLRSKLSTTQQEVTLLFLYSLLSKTGQTCSVVC
jgi:hypothetical protein